jgi:hypothetical protein
MKAATFIARVAFVNKLGDCCAPIIHLSISGAVRSARSAIRRDSIFADRLPAFVPCLDPIPQAMMVKDLKLVYLPLAENGCSSLKQMVASLGGVELEPGEDIHIKLDTERTGLKFADRSEDEIRHALSSPDWMRFVVIRDPLDRLMSAYIEKFILHRNHPRIEETVGPTYRAVFRKDDLATEEFARGITFREFVEVILAEIPKLWIFIGGCNRGSSATSHSPMSMTSGSLMIWWRTCARMSGGGLSCRG